MREYFSKARILSFFKMLTRCVGILVVVFIVVSISQVLIYKWVTPPFSNLMLIRKWEKRKDPTFTIDYRWVKYKNISNNFKRAVIVAEDHMFFDHKGVIFGNILMALKLYVRRDKTKPPTHGYSTITQQTAKNLFLYPSKTITRKALEIYYATLMEQILGKERIFEIYLNIIECSDGVFGAEAASMKFFKKPASLMSRQQACILAGALTNPRDLELLKPDFKRLRKAQKLYKVITTHNIKLKKP